MRFRRSALGSIFAMATLVLSSIASVPASASTVVSTDTSAAALNDHPVTGALDPATFAGSVMITTDDGPVYAHVDAGELPGKAESVRDAVAKGKRASSMSDAAVAAGCGSWHNAVAGPNVWWTSAQGCAIFGSKGYKHYYSWSNQSDVTACVKGKGFTSSGSVTWKSLGCSSTADVAVSWGNVLAYSQTKGLSVSVVTGASYRWFT